MLYEIPYFELGETMDGTNDDGVPINHHVLGSIFTFPAQRLGVGQRGNKTRWTGGPITAIALRNISGIALTPQLIVRMAYGTAGASTISVGGVTYNETNIAAVEGVDGYTATLAEKCPVIVDPFLPSGTTVADNDIFWGILKGRVMVKTPVVDTSFNGDIAVGDELVACTGTTSGATTSGRVSNVTLAGQTAGTVSVNMARYIVGTALSARTTANTNADILIQANILW